MMGKWTLLGSAMVLLTAIPAAAQPVPLNGTGDVASVVAGAAQATQTGQTAVTPATATADDVAKLKAMAEYINAQTALQTAQTAAATAKVTAAATNLGPLATTQNTGVVTAGTNAGKLEGTLLAARATEMAADALAMRLCSSLVAKPDSVTKCARGYITSGSAIASPVAFVALPAQEACASFAPYSRPYASAKVSALVIMANSQKVGFDAYDLLTMRLNAVGRQLCSAIAAGETAKQRTVGVQIPTVAPPKAKAGLVAGFLPAVSAGVDLVAKLFRSEYTVANIDITTDDQLLEKDLIRALYARDIAMPIYAPDLHTVVDLSDNPVVEMVKVLDELVRKAEAAAEEQASKQSAFTAGASLVKGDDQTVLKSAAAVHDAAAKALAAAVKAYGDILATATTGDADKPNLLTTAIRQAKVAEILRSGGRLLVAKMDAAGATTYTKRNFFTAFGAMPFYASGGVVASYALVDGSTGQILDASSVPIAGGFRRVSDVHRTGF